MKRIIPLLFLYLQACTSGFSQMRAEILPQSKLNAGLSENIPEIVLPRFPLAEIEKLDRYDEAHGRVPKISRDIISNINTHNSGEWSNVAEGRVWRVQVTSHGALDLIPLFDSLYLPEGSTLHFYTPGGQQILGAFTNLNTPQIRSFSCGIIRGESFIIEYYEPATDSGEGILDLYRVGYGYRGLRDSTGQIDTTIDCEVNVICPEGDNWRQQIRTVVQLAIHTDTQGSDNLCSGVLINNVRQDGTPYILSAMHCLDGVTLPSDFGEFVFTFHYQDTLCQGPDLNPPVTIVNGCTKIATSNDNEGATGSDFMLLEMLQKPDNADSACYAGWYNGPSIPDTGVCIHHPGGGPKKISTYGTPAFSTSWGNIVPNTHWGVEWDTSITNPGITAKGSSGSPLFNQNGLVVGHLSGGISCCVLSGDCNETSYGPDFFGKVSFDWTSDGVDSNEQLKPWLDPDNTGTTTLAGWCPTNVGINPIAVNPFFMQLMPNPSSGSFKLLFNTNEEKTIRIFDALGRNIMTLATSGMNVQIDLSAYSKGMYIIEAGNANGNNVQKLILN